MRKRSEVSSGTEVCSNALWLYEANLLDGYPWVLGHDGSDAGISTYAYFNPETGVGYILLTNSDMDGKGSVDDTSMAIGAKLMKTFDKKSVEAHAGHWRGSTKKSRRSSLKLRAVGYPGSRNPPGCSGGATGE